MNAILTKERRSLRPALIATVAVTIAASLLFTGSDAWGIVVVAYAIGACMIAASAFGNEFHTRTMLLLLSQPVSRRRLWLDKMCELALELAVSYAVLLLSLAFLVHGEGRLHNFGPSACAFAFIPLIAFCSTPFASLWIKNTLGAIAFTIGLPWALVMLVVALDTLVSQMLLGRPKTFGEVADEQHPALLASAVVTAALAYCLVFYWLGYRKFLDYQLVDSQAQDIRLPEKVERTLARWLAKLVPGYTGPWASLMRKELRLHRVSFIVAGLTVLVMPVLGTLWMIHPSELFTILALTPLILCAFGIPLLTGLVTVAEERNLGVLAGQLTQPVSPRKQWAAKMLVALGTCFVLGVILPAAITSVGSPQFRAGLVDFLNGGEGQVFTVLFYLVYFVFVIYASSFSPNVIRALVATFGLLAMCGVAVYLGQWASIETFSTQLQDRRGANYGAYITTTYTAMALSGFFIFLGIALVNYFSFANYRAVQPAVRRIWIQLSAIVLLAFIIGFTALVAVS